MFRSRIVIGLAALAVFCAGCETTDLQEEPAAKEQKPKMSKAEKKRKALRDPISDMLKIERKESKPFLADSGELSDREKEAFAASWSSQHKESEELHQKVRRQHDKEKKGKTNWVFFD